MTRGVSNQTKNHQLRVNREHQSITEGGIGESVALVYLHNPRHIDVLVKDLGLEQGNSVQTPATHDVTEEELEPLDQAQHSKYGSQVARCLFFSQDRADINIHRDRVMSKDVKLHTT